LVETKFGCKITDSYSCEGGANVSECETHNCYHSSMEYALTEILSDDKEVDFGGRGKLITTDLHNLAVPFIRYDTQDYVVKSKQKCDCGRNLLAIEKIDGRDSDILITPKGKYLILHNFTGYFEWAEAVDQFQVQQNEIDKINIIIKVNNMFNNKIQEDIYKYFSNYIGDGVRVTINIVEDIPLAKSGKRRFLIRDKNIKLEI